MSAQFLALYMLGTGDEANNANLDEMAHNEPPQLDLHCLPSSL